MSFEAGKWRGYSVIGSAERGGNTSEEARKLIANKELVELTDVDEELKVQGLARDHTHSVNYQLKCEGGASGFDGYYLARVYVGPTFQILVPPDKVEKLLP